MNVGQKPNQQGDNGKTTNPGGDSGTISGGRGKVDGGQEKQDNSRQGGSGVGEAKSTSAALDALGQIRFQANQAAWNSSGDYYGDGGPLYPGNKVNHWKRRLILALQIFIPLGIIAIFILGLILYGHVKDSQQQSRDDTAKAVMRLEQDIIANQKTIMCMLQVPLAQRTDDFAQACTKDNQPTNNSSSINTESSASVSSVSVTTEPISQVATITTQATSPALPATDPAPIQQIEYRLEPLNKILQWRWIGDRYWQTSQN